eukprot:CAMPEP_0118925912 /NCGR_PEP_ID=MMETSP1169-20130426/3707_1 /TAXON_ID=36882 /ORGANISM="Pyramimonas obovata, Strain CCMP722" /LENGTH=207 /DNA_ID=CAMNT_0006867337 /DNA_START=56 /DNA_END=679 /DNA_ORIENTATION=-
MSTSEPENKTIAEASKEQKGDLSYHYFHNEKGGEAPAAAPKKITEEEALELHRTTSDKLVGGASLWNAAGTWEERGYLGWAKQQLATRLVGVSDNVVTITEIKSCTGEATVVCTRGKARYGFDLVVSLGWEATVDEATIKGSVDINEVSRDTVEDDELEYKVNIDSDSKKESKEKKAKAEAGVKALMRKIREQLVAFDSDFKSKAES